MEKTVTTIDELASYLLHDMQNTTPEAFAAKLAGYLAQTHPGWDAALVASEYRYYFNNSDDRGRRNQSPHPSCY